MLLDILAAAPSAGLSLTEIAQRCGLSPPTTRRMLKVLATFGAVEQRDRSRRYVIGSRIPVWAAARPPHLRLIDVVSPFLNRASEEIGHTAFLSHRTDLDATCIAHISPGEVPLVPLGSRRPLGMPACSWAMLAELPDEEADGIVLRNHERLHRNGVEAAEIHRRLRETRRRGFAFRKQGRVTGLTTVSLAIRPLRSSQLAAITVTQRPEVSSPAWIDRAARFLHECSEAIELNMRA
jgi:DNA-binding IclR family transcriptional regulator